MNNILNQKSLSEKFDIYRVGEELLFKTLVWSYIMAALISILFSV